MGVHGKLATGVLLMAAVLPFGRASAEEPPVAEPPVESAEPAEFATLDELDIPPLPARNPMPLTAPPGTSLVELPNSDVVSILPERALDTRTNQGGNGPITSGATIELDVTGIAGIPDNGVGTVYLNITAVNATGTGFVTAYPTNSPRPNTASLTYTNGNGAIPNLAVTRVSPTGTISLYVEGSPTNLVIDLFAWSPTGSDVVSILPERALDTRTNQGGNGPITSGATIELDVTGIAGIPDNGVGTVYLNITAVNATGTGFVTAYPTNSPRPNTASLTYTNGNGAIPNLAVTRVSPTGTISLYVEGSPTNLVIDLFAWSPTGSDVVSILPERALDTRTNQGGNGPITSGETIELDVTGIAGIPDNGVGTVYLNITAVNATGTGFVTAYPTNSPRPNTASLTYTNGNGAIPNLAVTRVSPTGTISLYVEGSPTNLVIDLFAWSPTGDGGSSRFAVPDSTLIIDGADVVRLEVEKTVGTIVLSDLVGDVQVDGHVAVLPGTAVPGGYVGRVTAAATGDDGLRVITTVEVGLSDAFVDYDLRLDQEADDPTASELAPTSDLISAGQAGLNLGGIGNWECSGSPSAVATLTASLKNIKTDFTLVKGGVFGQDSRLFMIMSADLELGYELGISGEVTCEYDGPDIELPLPLAGANLEIEPEVSVTLSGQFAVEQSMKRRLFVAIDVDRNGFNNKTFGLYEREASPGKAQGSGSASLFVGIGIEVEYLGKIGLEIVMGPELEATFGGSPCVAVDLNLKVVANLELDLWLDFEWEIASATIQLGRLFSVDPCPGGAAPPDDTSDGKSGEGGSDQSPDGSGGGGSTSTPSGPVSFTVSPARCSVDICNSSASAQTGSMSGFTPSSAVRVAVFTPNGQDANTQGAPYRYITSASTNSSGKFSWKYWWEPGMVTGTYHTRVTDVRTGQSAGASFEYVASGGTEEPPPSSDKRIALSRGAAISGGYWYSVSLSGFSPGSSVTLTCRDSVDPGGFWTQTFAVSPSGTAGDSTLCYSADGPDHWVTGGGVESNHVTWSDAPPPPTKRITLAQGAPTQGGYWYNTSLTGFTPGSSVTVTCRDSVDPGGFWTQSIAINSSGNGGDSTLCFSADGPDHWVTGGGVESNHVTWNGAPPPPTKRITLARGAPISGGYWYNTSLTGFTPGSSVTVTCRDSVDPGGFWTQSIAINSSGNGGDSTLCFSADGPDHWVTGGGVESNHVGW